MKPATLVKPAFLLLASVVCQTSTNFALAAESTLPMPPYTDNVNPDLAKKYVFTQDGDYTKALNMPTYEWMPADTSQPLKAIFLGIHGMTLHGRLFRVLARSLAINGAGFVSLDMRGFGRCKFDDQHLFSTKDDDKTKVDHEKSYQAIVQLATLIKQKYPDVKLIPIGESLGCTFCVRLAAEHPELVQAIAISAPAVKVNKDMYAGHGQIRQGVKAILKPDHEVDLKPFFADLCSNRPEVKTEMTDDPMIRKQLKIGELLSTDKFVDKTEDYGKKTSPDLSVLILQGSADGCVSPKHVTDLMNAMPSADQSLEWRGNYGHLQLETSFMRAQTISAIANWLISHNKDQQAKIAGFQDEIRQLGGTVTK
jgi:alpha-beta hydrolase superfamily lysophospholipase